MEILPSTCISNQQLNDSPLWTGTAAEDRLDLNCVIGALRLSLPVPALVGSSKAPGKVINVIDIT
jgi:hypothetical protein